MLEAYSLQDQVLINSNMNCRLNAMINTVVTKLNTTQSSLLISLIYQGEM